MQFTKITSSALLLFTLLATGVVANPTPNEDVGAVEDSVLEKRGFGCPGDRYQCNSHCKSLKGGRTGGYCGGPLWRVCKCVFG